MTRREFLAASAAAGTATLATTAAMAAEGQSMRQFFELRLYHLRRGPMVKQADDYFRDAFLPACKRLGIGPVGVFNVLIGPDTPTMYVLITHSSLESLVTLPSRLAADADHQRAGALFLTANSLQPAFASMETILLQAFESMPKIDPPPLDKPHIVELRTYRSHSEAASIKKVEMFDKGGEIAIFRRLGITPVFFSQTLVGPAMPNITYMVTYPDLTSREKNWTAFAGDPEWKKLSAIPGYTDPEIVTSINNAVLRPTSYSQI